MSNLHVVTPHKETRHDGSQAAGSGVDAEALILRHQAAIWRYLRVCGCEPNEADDLTQDVFVGVLGSATFEHRSDRSTRRYLLRAARLRFLQRHDRRARRQEVAWTEAVDSWFADRCQSDGGNAWMAALAHCRARLQGRARSVLEMFYVEKRSRRDIASRLGMKETGVKTLLQRVRCQLRECIEKELAR